MNNQNKFQYLLLFLVLMNLLPHLEEHFLITISIGGICVLWRSFYLFQIIPLAHKALKVFLVCASTALVFYEYKTLFGIEASTAILICAISLKLIDNNSYRDSMVIIFLNILLIMAKIIVQQTLLITIFMSINLIFIISLLIYLHRAQEMQFSIKGMFSTSLKLSLQISPLLILLFFIFPRFSVGFVKLNTQKKSKSGFSV
jgi:hypothetical protein